jgi:hypothetical protein
MLRWPETAPSEGHGVQCTKPGCAQYNSRLFFYRHIIPPGFLIDMDVIVCREEADPEYALIRF